MSKILIIIAGMMLLNPFAYADGKYSEAHLVRKEYEPLIKLWDTDRTKATKKYKELLKSGTKYQKEAVLNIFQKKHITELVPSVIESILDDTTSAPLGDTGWSRVYHQAATLMCQYSQKIDGKDQKERGGKRYSFSSDGGVASEKRRKEVYNNWKKWWEANKKKCLKKDD